MPPAKVKPSEVAAEAKKTYIPYIRDNFSHKWPAHSWRVPDSTVMRCESRPEPLRCRMTVLEGDPIDVALELAVTIEKPGRVALINMANDKRAGGDWEAGIMAPEECLCRRSNLVATLNTPSTVNNGSPINYPIPPTGGIYSPFVSGRLVADKDLTSVVIFRAGPDKYSLWQKFKTLPVISVSPVRRPKLDQTGLQYSFEQEKELMKEKIRTILRMAVWWGYSDLALGAFGCGPIFRNPTREVATLWRDMLYFDQEFKGHFSNVVFVFDPLDGSNPNPSPNGSSNSGLKSSSSVSKYSSLQAEMAIFKDVFDPAKMFPR